MTRPIIAIDIDDVLADNAKGFTQFSNERWGTTLLPSDYQEHWSNMWGVDHEEAERRAVEFHESDALGRYDHNESAFAVLTKLQQRFDLIIITSRRVLTKGETLAWIKARYPGVFVEDKIYFAGIWDTGISSERYGHTKGDLVRDLGVSYLIDDQLKHCIAASEHGIPAILFGDYSWNQVDTLPGLVTRVADWPSMLEYFDAQAA